MTVTRSGSTRTPSTWTGASRSAARLDAARSDEPICYQLSPLAELQWRATVDWAELHGGCEVALHGVGDPATRRVCYFACGRQRVSGALCETLPDGVAEIAQAAASADLRMLCQVHHHPASVQRRTQQGAVRFFLSGTDLDLLAALARDLASGVLLFEPAWRRGSVTLRTGERTELRTDGRRFELALEPGTRLTIAGAELESLRAVAEVFVAVTGSDGSLHGRALRTEICQDCGGQIKRSLHPLSLRVTADFGEQHLAAAFDARAWTEELDEKVQRYRYYSSSKAPRRGSWFGRPTRHAPPATGTSTYAEPHAVHALSAEMTRWLDVLEDSAADGADARVTGALDELRSLAEDLAALTGVRATGPGHTSRTGGDGDGYGG